MKIGTTNLVKAMIGSSALSKIFIGTTKIWENWVYYTGILFNMTSNTTPSPFVVNGNDNWYSNTNHSEFWKAFNNLGDDVFFSRSDNLVYAYLFINIINAVKPKQFYIKLNHSYGNYNLLVQGSNDNASWDTLHSILNTSGSKDTNIEVTTESMYKYYRIGICSLGSFVQIKLEQFLLKEWYKKG